MPTPHTTPPSLFLKETPTTHTYTFPYTTLFRSDAAGRERARRDRDRPAGRARRSGRRAPRARHRRRRAGVGGERGEDRKSTRLNSSHVRISYAVFCLKKKIR